MSKEKIYDEILKDAKSSANSSKRKNGKNYAIASLIIGIAGFLLPVPINLFTGIAGILLAKIAIENKAKDLGQLGGLASFLSILWFIISILVFRFV